MKILIGLFLIIHGLIHAAYFGAPKDPNYPFLAEKSWLVKNLGWSVSAVKPILITLAVISFLGFLLAGLSYLGWLVPNDWFRILAIVSAITSLLLIILSWNSWFVVGLAIDIVILYLMLFGAWK